ncbi:hypothetical protein J6590_000693 [Homalodisca vitripennis]|nr:hypothetical protein J6590_000693 [Homalodisca vitripennis]
MCDFQYGCRELFGELSVYLPPLSLAMTHTSIYSQCHLCRKAGVLYLVSWRMALVTSPWCETGGRPFDAFVYFRLRISCLFFHNLNSVSVVNLFFKYTKTTGTVTLTHCFKSSCLSRTERRFSLSNLRRWTAVPDALEAEVPGALLGVALLLVSAVCLVACVCCRENQRKGFKLNIKKYAVS